MVRERYLEAEGLASYLHRNQGKKEIRLSLDDIPVLLDQLTEVRAVLAPLLDEPLIYVGAWAICKICGDHTEEDRRPPAHKNDCPVLRRDALLGR